MWPRPPAPIITQFSPGRRCLVAFFATLYAVKPASEKGATSFGVKVFGILIRFLTLVFNSSE